MTLSSLTIANALITAKNVLNKMLSEGLSDPKYTFALSNLLCEKYNLTKDESLAIIENALKLK